MTGISQYTQEHELIGNVVSAFERYVAAVEYGDDLEKQDLALFITFFREFGDLGHHEKEESLLIPAMVRSGCTWDDGPVERVRREHHHERYLIRTLRQAAMQKDAWSREARRRVVSTARDYIHFMRAHVRLEEEELLPRARRCLGDEAQAELAEQCGRFDDDWNQAGELDWLRGIAADLIARHPRT